MRFIDFLSIRAESLSRAVRRPRARAVPVAISQNVATIGSAPADSWQMQTSPELDAARAALRMDLDRVDCIEAAGQVFNRVPLLLENADRQSAWFALDRHLENLRPDTLPDDLGRTDILRMRLKLALRDYGGFLAILDRSSLPAGQWLNKFHATASLLRGRPFPDLNGTKIFGIGLSRTGTKSLTRALITLGFNAAHFTNDFTGEILKLEDSFLFDALTDTPVCVIFEALYYLFPKAKFIYTTRPMQDWVISLTRHFQRNGLPNAFDTTRDRLTTQGAQPYGLQRAILHGALYYHHADPISARLSFDARVESFFARHDRSRLLRFDLFSGDGWSELCGFLDRSVPGVPFPWDNRAEKRD